MKSSENRINTNLSRKFVVDNTDIFEEKQIAKEFNKFFITIGPKLANEILTLIWVAFLEVHFAVRGEEVKLPPPPPPLPCLP